MRQRSISWSALNDDTDNAIEWDDFTANSRTPSECRQRFQEIVAVSVRSAIILSHAIISPGIVTRGLVASCADFLRQGRLTVLAVARMTGPRRILAQSSGKRRPLLVRQAMLPVRQELLTPDVEARVR